ncbi:MAG: flavodoxin family protein [Coriobacteriales bacterium]|jgi:multimeric flavodoxin WrbA|nr:flavodoxin family protein [Coriobacteriales bacterium]
MSSDKPDILFISGSPRSHACEALAALIEQAAVAAGAQTQRFFLSNKHIDPCMGCGACSKTGVCVLAGSSRGGRPQDDYLELHELIERTDGLVIVAPLYFAGPPAQFKALLDRFQPYWAKRYVQGEDPAPKRPAQLFIVGAGGDAHGHAPLSGIAKSALAVAGFNLEKVLNFVGFKAKGDTPAVPPEDQRDGISLGRIAQMRRALVAQRDFEQRALDAGGAFARYLLKVREKDQLQKELQLVEAELEAFKADADADEGVDEGANAAQAAGEVGAPADTESAPEAPEAPEAPMDPTAPEDSAT